jgi:hypothetical protein
MEISNLSNTRANFINYLLFIMIFKNIVKIGGILPFLVMSIVWALSYALFVSFHWFGVETDIYIHLEFASAASTDWKLYPANFGIYLLTNSLSVFMPDYYALPLVLSFSIAIKFIFSYYIAAQIMQEDAVFNMRIALFLAICAIIVFAIPYRIFLGENIFYYGLYVPNVWHNSTIIASMPFVLIVFWLSYKEFIAPSLQNVYLLCLSVVLLSVFKPSFLFIYCPAFAIMFFAKYKFNIKYLAHYAPLVVAVLAVFAQWLFTYPFNSGAVSESSVTISPFGHLKSWSNINMFPLAILSSVLSPILLLTAAVRPISKLSVYAILLFVFSLFFHLLLAETGKRFSHGNFYWQIVPAVYLLFLLSLAKIPAIISSFGKISKARRIVAIIALVLMVAHVLAGILYIYRFFVVNHYC